jgi:hypothetical protein
MKKQILTILASLHLGKFVVVAAVVFLGPLAIVPYLAHPQDPSEIGDVVQPASQHPSLA